MIFLFNLLSYYNTLFSFFFFLSLFSNNRKLSTGHSTCYWYPVIQYYVPHGPVIGDQTYPPPPLHQFFFFFFVRSAKHLAGLTRPEKRTDETLLYEVGESMAMEETDWPPYLCV